MKGELQAKILSTPNTTLTFSYCKCLSGFPLLVFLLEELAP